MILFDAFFAALTFCSTTFGVLDPIRKITVLHCLQRVSVFHEYNKITNFQQQILNQNTILKNIRSNVVLVCVNQTHTGEEYKVVYYRYHELRGIFYCFDSKTIRNLTKIDLPPHSWIIQQQKWRQKLLYRLGQCFSTFFLPKVMHFY